MTRHELEEWTGGGWHCKIVCSRDGHRRRLIDRLKVANDPRDSLYLSREAPDGEHWPVARDRSTFNIVFSSDGDDYEVVTTHHVLHCPTCRLNVRVGWRLLGQVARALREADAQLVELQTISAIVSKQ